MTHTPGFLARGKTSGGERLEDRFELRQAAIECCQHMEGIGYSEIECFEVRPHAAVFPWESSEKLIAIEWQCLVVDGGTRAAR